ncbi:hypothetical protein CAMGR0001_1142 [Campylobacter gracilis RM3268]|uniref:Uncharacterized protein n=1 Tax=Campylobacter gracilis RM3268 TaxID=553220 RepID=C8PIU3_9BACT|nr:hypothetical protein CAMGR0001_1142 [Campylobacter gracilis RM3268]
MGDAVLKFNQVFDVLLKQKPLESKIYRFITKFKKMAIVNHLASFRFPNFM